MLQTQDSYATVDDKGGLSLKAFAYIPIHQRAYKHLIICDRELKSPKEYIFFDKLSTSRYMEGTVTSQIIDNFLTVLRHKCQEQLQL